MDKEQAFHSFWSSFGIPAYDENTVFPIGENKPEFPYLTYDISVGDIDTDCYTNAHLYYRSSSWAGITEKSHEIERFFGFGERSIPFDDGYIRIWKGRPFYQRGKELEDKTIRVMDFNIVSNFIQTKY